MKKNYFLLIVVALLAFSGYATTINVSITDNAFSPATFTASIGDVVVWTQNGNAPHTTTSTNVPTGAATWNSGTMAGSSGATYSYTITHSGPHAYQCTFHASMFMLGGFMVSSPSGIEEGALNVSSVATPNPFKDIVTVNYRNADAITVYNVTGKMIKSVKLEAIEESVELDFSSLPSGVYFYTLAREGTVAETKRLVKE